MWPVTTCPPRLSRAAVRVHPITPRPWALPLVTTAGALVSALIVAKFAPEASGHGTDSAIEAIHTDPRHIRARVVVVKMISSALDHRLGRLSRP